MFNVVTTKSKKYDRCIKDKEKRIKEYYTTIATTNSSNKGKWRTWSVQNRQKQLMKCNSKSFAITVITLNVNGINSSIKRDSGWMNTKTRLKYMLSTGDSLYFFNLFKKLLHLAWGSNSWPTVTSSCNWASQALWDSL